MPRGAPPGSVWASISALLAVTGCSRPVMPDPKEAVARYAEAVQRGDAGAVHGMLTESAKKAYGIEDTRRLLNESRPELGARAAALRSGRASVETTAEVPYEDGEQAVLVLENGAFRISAAEALPAGARTPTQALSELRQVLARRSYPALARILTSDTRGALEQDIRTLVEGLERPDTLPVKVSGDRAEVELPGGHKVWLKKEGGVWRIANFD